MKQLDIDKLNYKMPGENVPGARDALSFLPDTCFATGFPGRFDGNYEFLPPEQVSVSLRTYDHFPEGIRERWELSPNDPTNVVAVVPPSRVQHHFYDRKTGSYVFSLEGHHFSLSLRNTERG